MNFRKTENIFEILSSFEEGGSNTLAKKVLVRVGFAGIVMSGMVAPGLLQAIDSTLSSQSKYSSRQVGKSYQYLKKSGLVTLKILSNGEKKIYLTQEGRKKLEKYYIDVFQLKKPMRWDKKWRVVIFDVPNNHNARRVVFREKIKSLGFKQVQKSVWVYPYRCEDEIFFLAKVLGMDKYVDIIVAQKFFNDMRYKKLFFPKKYK